MGWGLDKKGPTKSQQEHKHFDREIYRKSVWAVLFCTGPTQNIKYKINLNFVLSCLRPSIRNWEQWLENGKWSNRYQACCTYCMWMDWSGIELCELSWVGIILKSQRVLDSDLWGLVWGLPSTAQLLLYSECECEWITFSSSFLPSWWHFISSLPFGSEYYGDIVTCLSFYRIASIAFCII